jgi:precorrin-3B C17-methyltransferase
VSLGPGDPAFMIPQALEALQKAELIVGYKTYLDLIPHLTKDKKIISSGMKKEMQRCQDAINHALAGSRVALVSSGDAGIYGMAGLVFDICRERGLCVSRLQKNKPSGTVDFYVEVVPGVAAISAASSLVGAPLMHDFAVVSLSDHLTPWAQIEVRLDAAASADFVIAIYNPRSKTRPHLLERARDVILRHRDPKTPVAVVRRAMREGEWKCSSTLDDIPFHEVDMQSILIVGNSRTYNWNGWMVTPRGYLDRYSVTQE